MENKKRLIDANELRKKNVWMKMRTGTVYECDTRAVTVSTIDLAPTIDAVEVVHGRWKKDWCDNNMIGHEFEECSKCGCSMLDTNQFWDSNYCPNCGAKMDGDAK
jgi:hypothetical protein